MSHINGVWHFRLLGAFDVRLDGVPLGRLRSKSCVSLLAHLALHCGREFSRFQLEETVWPDRDADRQAQNLRKAVSDIRRGMAEVGADEILLTRKDFLKLQEAAVRTDVADFREMAHQKEASTDCLRRTIDAYGGAFVPELYDAWTVPVRMELEDTFARAACELIGRLVAEGDAREAANIGRGAALLAPNREDLQVELIRAYGAAGLASEALRQFEELERMLDEQFGEAPSDLAVAALEDVPRATRTVSKSESAPGEVALVFRQASSVDSAAAGAVAGALADLGVSCSLPKNGAKWTENMRARQASASVAVTIIGEGCDASELVEEELAYVDELRHKTGKPALIGLITGDTGPDGAIGSLLDGCPMLKLENQDFGRVALAIKAMLQNETLPAETWIEPAGGAIRLDSKFYVQRISDTRFADAMSRGDGTVLVKGARQVGKTSLLVRALAAAETNGFCTSFCDFQTVGSAQLSTDESLYRYLAHRLVRDTGAQVQPEALWNKWLAPNANLADIVESILKSLDKPVLWVFDEADRLFNATYCADFFGLLRSWHNLRAVHNGDIWNKLVLAIGYATEAHLFITDINQSPFNVGTRVDLKDFSDAEITELNVRYREPVKSQDDLDELADLTGGQPYLTRRAFDWLCLNNAGVSELSSVALQAASPFMDHLRRLHHMVSQAPDLAPEILNMLDGKSVSNPDARYRLNAIGLLAEGPGNTDQFRSVLYRDYLAHTMPA